MKKTEQNLGWLLSVSLFFLAFLSTPFLAGKLAQTENLRFRGIFFDEVDYSVHISMMQAGKSGETSYKLRFTTEEHSPAFLRMFYILLGHFSRWVNLEVEVVFQYARILFGLTALLLLFKLYSKVLSQPDAKFAFLLCIVGGGAGIIQLILQNSSNITPIDFWLIDAYFYFSVALFPSFSFTLALIIAGLILFFQFLISGNFSYIFLVCIAGMISQSINPISFAAVDITIATIVFSIWISNRKIDKRQMTAIGLIATSQIPLLAYNYEVLIHDPIWQLFTQQNQTLSPPPSYYLWGFAPFWIMVIPGFVFSIRNKNILMLSFSAWIIISFMLAYSPFLIQRRFLLGITIPLSALAVYGFNFIFETVIKKFPSLRYRKKFLIFTYLSLSSISCLALILGSSMFVLTRPTALFYSSDLEQALEWLNSHANPNDFVMGAIPTGQLIAQKTSLRTYAGHPMETLFFNEKVELVNKFYTGNLPPMWIQNTSIKWVIYGDFEKELISEFHPPSNLKLLFQNKTIKIYKVSILQ